MDEQKRNLRWKFYDNILSFHGHDLDEAYAVLAKQWVVSCRASWSWVWILSSEGPSKKFDLVSGYGEFCSMEEPDFFSLSSDNSAAAYCLETNNVVVVNDLGNWEKKHNGKTYSVGVANSLQKKGCAGFIAVPMMLENNSPEARGNRFDIVKGVVCVHWQIDSSWVKHGTYFLKLMGTVSARMLRAVHRAKMMKMLDSLNALAHDSVTNKHFSAKEIRSNYFDGALSVLMEDLHLQAASIFYTNKYSSLLECVATSGLKSANGEVITDLSTAVYSAGEGFTGKVYQEGRAKVQPKHEAYTGTAKYNEYIENEKFVTEYPATIIYPIKTEFYRKEAVKSVGVIRCSFHSSLFYSGNYRPFDPLEMEVLEFFVRQIAPIAAGLTATMWSELEQVGISHDITLGLKLIDAAVEKIESKEQLAIPRAIEAISLQIRLGKLLSQNSIRRLNSLSMAVHPIECSVEGLMKNVILPLNSYTKREKAMNVHCEGFNPESMIRFDRSMLNSVFSNLIMNAMKYGKRGTTISLKFGLIGDYYVVDISNVGDSIPPSIADNIFFPGVKGNSSNGEGMGLAITKKFMLDNGGDIILDRANNPIIFRLHFLRAE